MSEKVKRVGCECIKHFIILSILLSAICSIL